MGDELFERYLKAFEEEPPVSIRLNPMFAENCAVAAKIPADGEAEVGAVSSELEPVPWCRDGYFLPNRPAFTFDPLFHAGCYYVQEAASMFLDHVLRHLRQPFPQHSSTVLDLCAAPGGKSTILLSHLPEGSTLVSNEPIAKRAQILSENLQKWMLPDLRSAELKVKSEKLNALVSNAFPRDFRKSKITFDLILCDVPCSGEGMFRKDADTIGEWSVENVEKCWRLQREIVADAWACLRDGGYLIYSTCTLNIKENEENVRWMMAELGAEPVAIPIEADWHITGSLLPDFTAPVYRFIPGVTRGEGLFMAVLRKKGGKFEGNGEKIEEKKGKNKKIEPLLASLKTITNDFLNTVAEALDQQAPCINLDYEQAIQYLRREAIVLPPETPRGIVIVCYDHQLLGLAKNIGSRANNLYPKEWRIKSTYIPNQYEAIFRHSRPHYP